MLRLCHALHEAPPDPVARKRAMLEGLCRLVGADAGVCVVSAEQGAAPGPAGARHSVTVSVVRFGLTEEDAHALAARYRSKGSAAGRAARREVVRPRSRADSPDAVE